MTRFLQTSVQVGSVRTEIVVQPFGDRILVLVSQVGKVGQLIQASIPSTTVLHQVSDELPTPPPAIQLMPIFGSAPSADMCTLYSLYAAQIATLIWSTTRWERRSVVVGIALKQEEEKACFHAVMHTLQDSLVGLGLE